MASDGLARFTVRFEAEAADEADAMEQTESLTRQLRRDLNDLDDIEVSALAGAPAPDGAKGDPLTNALIVSAFSSGITVFVNYMNEWVRSRKSRCTVVIEHDHGRIEFPGARPEDVDALLQRFNSSPKPNT
jgi:hypothetical protein